MFSATFKVPESVKWLKLNYKNTGFYAVHYKDESWAALGEALSQNVSVLTQEDRASLIHNIFALSKSVFVLLSGCVLFSCFIFTGEFRGVFSNSRLPCGINRFGRVSFLRVLNLLDYMVNETETSPVKEALLQLNTIYRLLDKRQEHGLVARMKVQLSTAAKQCKLLMCRLITPNTKTSHPSHDRIICCANLVL